MNQRNGYRLFKLEIKKIAQSCIVIANFTRSLSSIVLYLLLKTWEISLFFRNNSCKTLIAHTHDIHYIDETIFAISFLHWFIFNPLRTSIEHCLIEYDNMIGKNPLVHRMCSTNVQLHKSCQYMCDLFERVYSWASQNNKVESYLICIMECTSFPSLLP